MMYDDPNNPILPKCYLGWTDEMEDDLGNLVISICDRYHSLVFYDEQFKEDIMYQINDICKKYIDNHKKYYPHLETLWIDNLLK